MKLLFRTDGDREIGAGHVMRMLALADHAHVAGHDVRFASARVAAELAERIAKDYPLERALLDPGSDEDAAWTSAFDADWVLTDGYAFEDRFQAKVRDAGRRHLVVDDYGHCDEYVADVVLNTNVYAEETLYPRRAAHTSLLLGAEYALLRPEFLQHPPRTTCEPPRILVTMGGADPVDATAWVIAALQRVVAQFDADVVVGPANPNLSVLQTATAEPHIRVRGPVDGMASLMASATIAIAGAGITTYELAFMGVPSMLVVLADNQVPVAEAMASRGAAIGLGWHRALDAAALAERIEGLLSNDQRRHELTTNGRAMVDGRGAERVLARLADGV